MNIETTDICVIGAGISGLSLAAFASVHSKICVLETESTVGGILTKTQSEQHLFDHAANGWLDNEPSVHELVELIGASDQVLPANTHKGTRYLVYNNELHALSPKLLFRSTPLISWKDKCRFLLEIFKGRIPHSEPSMTEVMQHRFGTGVIDNFVAPMCAGIYASPPEEISVPAAFPRFWTMLQNGSLIRQILGRLFGKTQSPPKLTSLSQGTGDLCHRIAAYLESNGHSVHTNSPATQISYQNDQWVIKTPNQMIHARKIALTCPARIQAQLLSSHASDIAQMLTTIQYAPVVVVLLQFDRDQFADTPIGFGALLTREEQRSGLLGILFTSHLYPTRFQRNTVATRSILGGAIVPEMIDRTDEQIIEIALNKHRSLFHSPNATPSFVQVIRWSNGIPQYTVGHQVRQHAIQTFHEQNPNIRLSGNHIFGVSIKDCIRIGREHATDFHP